MSLGDQGSWLFLLFNLPAKHSSDRVKLWRRLKRFGAIQLKTSTYVLPDEPVHYERFQWLAKEIVDNGGEAALVRVKDIEGMPNAAVVAMFNDARGRDYDEIAEPLTLLIKETKSRKSSPLEVRLRAAHNELLIVEGTTPPALFYQPGVEK
jgi:hypothetical protein